MIKKYSLTPKHKKMLSGARCIDSGRAGSRLLRKEVEGDEPLVMVELINSTPEPDGHFKKYLIRVPPTTTTVDQAVAWIWP